MRKSKFLFQVFALLATSAHGALTQASLTSLENVSEPLDAYVLKKSILADWSPDLEICVAVIARIE